MPELTTLPDCTDTMPYHDLLVLVLTLRDDVRALQEQVRRLENRLAKAPVEQGRMAL